MASGRSSASLERRELMNYPEEQRQRWKGAAGHEVGSVPGGARSAVRAARRSARRFGSRASARSTAQRWLRDRSRSSRLRSLRAQRRGPLYRRVLDGERAGRNADGAAATRPGFPGPRSASMMRCVNKASVNRSSVASFSTRRDGQSVAGAEQLAQERPKYPAASDSGSPEAPTVPVKQFVRPVQQIVQ